MRRNTVTTRVINNTPDRCRQPQRVDRYTTIKSWRCGARVVAWVFAVLSSSPFSLHTHTHTHTQTSSTPCEPDDRPPSSRGASVFILSIIFNCVNLKPRRRCRTINRITVSAWNFRPEIISHCRRRCCFYLFVILYIICVCVCVCVTYTVFYFSVSLLIVLSRSAPPPSTTETTRVRAWYLTHCTGLVSVGNEPRLGDDADAPVARKALQELCRRKVYAQYLDFVYVLVQMRTSCNVPFFFSFFYAPPYSQWVIFAFVKRTSNCFV